jgi:hypothetical protein
LGRQAGDATVESCGGRLRYRELPAVAQRWRRDIREQESYDNM